MKSRRPRSMKRPPSRPIYATVLQRLCAAGTGRLRRQAAGGDRGPWVPTRARRIWGRSTSVRGTVPPSRDRPRAASGPARLGAGRATCPIGGDGGLGLTRLAPKTPGRPIGPSPGCRSTAGAIERRAHVVANGQASAIHAGPPAAGRVGQFDGIQLDIDFHAFVREAAKLPNSASPDLSSTISSPYRNSQELPEAHGEAPAFDPWSTCGRRRAAR